MPIITFHQDAELEEHDLSLSILDIALKHNIPHMHICGGKARCSTCRIMIQQGLENVLPRNAIEQQLADQKGMAENIRLACQTHIKGPVTLRRLVKDDVDVGLAKQQHDFVGREQKLAILFSDIRGFTDFAERHFPYDVIHILNRYYQQMGTAVLDNQGYIDKYIGDGLMALFGIDHNNAEENCLNAIAAAVQMLASLDKVNLYLQQNFNEKFTIGIGIHFGNVVLGNVGHHSKVQLTAIGDAVNVASRIEQQTKGTQRRILVSDAVYDQVSQKVIQGSTLDSKLRGKQQVFKLHEILDLKKPRDVLNSEI